MLWAAAAPIQLSIVTRMADVEKRILTAAPGKILHQENKKLARCGGREEGLFCGGDKTPAGLSEPTWKVSIIQWAETLGPHPMIPNWEVL